MANSRCSMSLMKTTRRSESNDHDGLTVRRPIETFHGSRYVVASGEWCSSGNADLRTTHDRLAARLLLCFVSRSRTHHRIFHLEGRVVGLMDPFTTSLRFSVVTVLCFSPFDSSATLRGLQVSSSSMAHGGHFAGTRYGGWCNGLFTPLGRSGIF